MTLVPIETGEVVGFQRKVRVLGNIRMGERDPDKGYPKKLQNFRITSSDKDKLDAIERRYGGKVTPWEKNWQVTLEEKKLHVLIPPWAAYSLSWNLWAGPGNRQRLCDGAQMRIKEGNRCRVDDTGQLPPCMCPEDLLERSDKAKPAGKGRPPTACSPHFSAQFILDGLDMQMDGVWVLNSKGMNASAEMPVTMDKLIAISEFLARHDKPQKAGGVLWIENRESKQQGQATRNFIVPVLEPDVSDEAIAELPGYGEAMRNAIAGRQQPALPARWPDPEALPEKTVAVPVQDSTPEAPVQQPDVVEATYTELPDKTEAPTIAEPEIVEPPKIDHGKAMQRYIIVCNEAHISEDEQREWLERVSDGKVTSRADGTKEIFEAAVEYGLDSYRTASSDLSKDFFGPDGRGKAAEWMAMKAGIPLRQFGLLHWVKVVRLLEEELSQRRRSRVTDGNEDVETLPW